MKKKIVLSSILSILLITGLIPFYVHNKANNSGNSALIKDKAANKIKNKDVNTLKNAKEINDKFYSHKKINQSAENALVGYPSTFSGLINISQLVVVGQVTNLHSFVNRNMPNTIVDTKVKYVLKGDKGQTNKTIRVMFPGGNITRKALLSTVSDKPFMHISPEEANSEEIVTVNNPDMPLPKVGENFAFLLTKEPSGADNIPGEFWSIDFASKGLFPENAQGKYERIAKEPSIKDPSGKPSRDLSQEDDIKMNHGMNELINKVRTGK